jgi:membrane-associated PAP2 superfamily phosphatase
VTRDGHPGQRFAARAALGSLALLVLWEAAGLDLWAAHLYGTTAGFAWRETWLTQAVLHDGGRWLAAVVLVLLAADAARPEPRGPSRRERLYWLAVMVAALLLVPLLKRFSLTSCPWDLAEFGGRAAYVPHWLPGVADGGAGHCFPSGHAVGAFAFFGVFFLWLPYRPRRAWASLAAVLVVGSAFGWAQLARGAHFVSHTLWSAWLCWTLAWVAATVGPSWLTTRGRGRRQAHRAREHGVQHAAEAFTARAPPTQFGSAGAATQGR